MFNQNDKLVCINDEPYLIAYRDGMMQYEFPIRKGVIVTVHRFIPAGTVVPTIPESIIRTDHIACGYRNVLGFDAWPLDRFRRPVGLDFKQALADLKDMPNTIHREMTHAR